MSVFFSKFSFHKNKETSDGLPAVLSVETSFTEPFVAFGLVCCHTMFDDSEFVDV